jgi:predicted AlkP superfamily pyrophosphatase or phosphodiesterase
VLVTVDQLPSYLYQRYDSLFTGGFRRLQEEGRYYPRAVHDYGETWTSAGHATLGSGVYPSRHGIVENDWWEEIDGEMVNIQSVDDQRVEVVGHPNATGRSPMNLKTTGLADWLAEAYPEAEVVSISAKPTSSLLMAAKSRGQVYYFEESVGRFVTTSYYRAAYPDWVNRFNDERLPDFLADSVWESEVPEALVGLARPDAADYEGDRVHTTFPHRYYEEVQDRDRSDAYYKWWADTPALDMATLDFAREALAALFLGQRDAIDFLAVGFSQTDRVGHKYGPYSLEQLDNLIRVDRLIGEFLDLLDREVGADRYVLIVTSDHGSPGAAPYLVELGESGRHVTRAERRAIRAAAAEITSGEGSYEEKRAVLTRMLEALDFVEDAMTVDELAGGELADSFIALYQRSYYPGRVPGPFGRYGLVLRYKPGTNFSSDVAMHGSPYAYDQQIPLFVFGAGIEPEIREELARSVDVAPTLAELAGIPYPHDLDGRPLVTR